MSWKKITSQPLKNAFIISAIYILFLTNFLLRILSFVEPTFNGIAIVIFLLIPFLLIINGLFFPKLWQKLINLLFFSLPILLSILIFTNPIIILFFAVYQPDHEIRLKNYNLTIYNKSAGFLINPSQGFVLHQEKVIFPGIKITKKIYTNNSIDLYAVDYQTIDNTVILDFIYFDNKGRQNKISKELELKKFVYF
jgi:hypothetical protein